jgi:DNA-binding winged helix-turn-helix (wHTH) protein
MQDNVISFGPYRLDPRGGLMAGTRPIRLTPKSLALLCFLAERPGQLVTKHELFAAIWPETTVSDAALVSCIQEIRKALRDDARRPRYIETLHRRGYRFVSEPAPSAVPPQPDPTILVGREEELAQLHAALARARAGQRQIVFVTGEPGIGKTSLVTSFVAQAAARGDVRVAWGQSAEHYGAAEPYLPVLEALVRAGRSPSGERSFARSINMRPRGSRKCRRSSVPAGFASSGDAPVASRASGCCASSPMRSRRRHMTHRSCCGSRTSTGPTRRRSTGWPFSYDVRSVRACCSS